MAVVMLGVPGSPADAEGTLPSPVRQSVDSSLASWSATGDTAAVAAAVVDLCAKNPGVALDIVAYAGEAAARSDTPAHCIVSDTDCSALDQLIALLYEQALKVSGGAPGITQAGTGGGSGTTPGGGSGGGGTTPPGGGGGGGIVVPLPPCVQNGTCGGEPPPTSQSRL